MVIKGRWQSKTAGGSPVDDCAKSMVRQRSVVVNKFSDWPSDIVGVRQSRRSKGEITSDRSTVAGASLVRMMVSNFVLERDMQLNSSCGVVRLCCYPVIGGMTRRRSTYAKYDYRQPIVWSEGNATKRLHWWCMSTRVLLHWVAGNMPHCGIAVGHWTLPTLYWLICSKYVRKCKASAKTLNGRLVQLSNVPYGR